MDIMFLAKEKFLISIASSLELTIVSVVGSMTKESLGSSIQAQVTLLCSRAFEPYLIRTDPQSGLKACKDSFPGIEFDISGAGKHPTKINDTDFLAKQ